MSNTYIVISTACLILLTILLLTALGFGIFVAYRYTVQFSNKFEVQMAMAEAQSSMANPLKFDDLIKIVNDIVMREVVTEFNSGRYTKMTDEELSLILADVLAKISTQVHTDLGADVLRQWAKFTSEEYLQRFILEMVRTAFLLKVEADRERPKKNILTSPKQSQTKNKKDNRAN